MADFKTNPNRCILCGEAKRVFVAQGTDFEYATTDKTFKFYQCSNCSLIFIDPIPDSSVLSLLYPQNYYAYRTGEYNRFIKNMRARQLDAKAAKFLARAGWKKQPDFRILEIGCGTGDQLLAFRRINRGFNLCGIDYSSDAIESVKSYGIKGYAGNVMRIDPGEQKFDLIICQQIIEHLHDPFGFVKRIRQWLAPDGVLIIETPGIDSVDRKIFKGCWGGYHIPRHFYLFSEKAIGLLLEKAGFKVREFFYEPCMAFWLWSFHNCVTKYLKCASLANFFSLRNPVAILPFWIIEKLRRPFTKTASMGIVAGIGE